ncbi:MAG: hypothetical protein ACRD2E_07915 [Terriglobales bacterium]
MAAAVAPRLSAQNAIRILVLNGRTGKPITNECLNVFFPRGGGGLLAVDGRGVATLPIAGTARAASPAAETRLCAPVTPRLAAPADGSFQVLGDYYVACQEYSFPHPPKQVRPSKAFPNYSIRQILRTGVVASNTCGKARAKPKPGELIFFERPRTFWEKLRE